MALTEKLKKAFVYAGDDVLLFCIEFVHASLTAPIRLVRGYFPESVTHEAGALVDAGTSVKYEPYQFIFPLPAISDNPNFEHRLRIDNTDLVIINQLRKAINNVNPVIFHFRIYLKSDLTTPQFDPPLKLKLTSINMNLSDCECVLKYSDILDRTFPSTRYTTDLFPSLREE